MKRLIAVAAAIALAYEIGHAVGWAQRDAMKHYGQPYVR